MQMVVGRVCVCLDNRLDSRQRCAVASAFTLEQIAMLRCCLIAAALLCIAAPARADPGPVVNYLLKTPVSLFGSGLIRLSQYLEKRTDGILSEKEKEYFSGISLTRYDWEKNRIYISYSVYKHGRAPEKAKLDSQDLKHRCKSIAQAFRSYGGVSTTTGAYVSELIKNSFYAEYFSPTGYTRNDAPERYLERLDKIIEIRVNLLHVHCSGELLSSKVLFEE